MGWKGREGEREGVREGKGKGKGKEDSLNKEALEILIMRNKCFRNFFAAQNTVFQKYEAPNCS